MKLNHRWLKLGIWALLAAWPLSPGLLRASGSWPTLMNYQGRLTDQNGVTVADGSYSITFNIYAVSNGGGTLWTEAQTVTVTKGLFDVVLGTVNPLSNISIANYTGDLWIGVTVGSDSEMTPRQQLLPAPYAKNSQTLAGLLPNNLANNLVVLDSSGKIPAGLVQGGSLTPPLNLQGSAPTYDLNVSNTSASSSALGLTLSGPNGLLAQATDPAGYAVWGQTAPTDGALAAAVKGIAGNGIGVLAESGNGTGVSATATQGTAIYAQTASASATNYAVVGINSGNATSGIGILGQGFTGVEGTATATSGRGVDGEVPSTIATAFGVRGANAFSTGTAVFGSHSGTGAGFGVRGGSVSGVAASGVYGAVSGTGGAMGVQGYASDAAGIGVAGRGGVIGVFGYVTFTGGAMGVEGIATAADGYGVVGKNASLSAGWGVQGQGNQGVYGLSAGDCGVYAVNVNGSAGAGLSASAPVMGIYAQSSATLVQGAGISATVQSNVAGSAAGIFTAMASNGNTYGISVSNTSNAATAMAIYATGGQQGVHSTVNTGGTNFFSDPAFSPAIGFEHADNSGPSGGIAVLATENCATCYGGVFSNLGGSGANSGAAMVVNGRLSLPYVAGTVGVLAGSSSFTISNNYISSGSLVFLTVATPTSVVAAVTSRTTGQATVTLSGSLATNTTYQYLIVGP
jgi:hypothetical protein